MSSPDPAAVDPVPLGPEQFACPCEECGCSTMEGCQASFEHYNAQGGPFIHDACCECVFGT